MRIYLSGPMTGYADDNFPAFHRTAAALRKAGFDVVNPAEITPGMARIDATSEETYWHACLRADLKAMMDCQGIALMPGWERSKGAQLEQHVAHRVGLHVLFVEDLIVEP